MPEHETRGESRSNTRSSRIVGFHGKPPLIPLLCIAALLYMSIIAMPVMAAGLADTPWPKFMQNIRNTGQSPYNGPQTANLVWTYATSNQMVYSGPSLAPDGNIIIGNYGKIVYAFKPDGTLNWSYTLPGFIYSTPAIADDGTIYVGSNDKKVYAFNPDGTIKWVYTTVQMTGRSSTTNSVRNSMTIAPDGTIYAGGQSGNLTALNPDGTLKWYYNINGSSYPFGSPAIGSDGTVYLGITGNPGEIEALNPDGTLKWSYLNGTAFSGNPSIASDGTLYAANTNGYLYALNPDGTLKWCLSGSNAFAGTPAIASDGTIYCGTNDGNIYAINADGTLKWTYTTGGSYTTLCSAVIGSDGTIYIGNNGDYKIYAINPDGTFKWSYATGAGIRDAPAIGSDGTLYIGSNDYKVYAFRDPAVAPVAAFSGTPTTGTAPLTVAFTDASTNTPTSWAWTFGDGGTSTAQNPSHQYTADGTYTVTLTATNAGGSDSEEKIGYITVTSGGAGNAVMISGMILPSAPIAAFSGSPTSGDKPLTVAFTDASTGEITSYAWDFNNDGTTDSTSQNPSYTYTDRGTYTVKLTVSGPGGSDDETRSGYINVKEPVPVADFTYTPVSGPAPLTVAFTSTSTGVINSYAWDFNNDGTTDSTDANPSYIYTTAGTYTVKLTVTGPDYSDEEVKSNIISAGTATITVDVTPASIDFGTMSVGDQTGSTAVTVTTDGGTAWSITAGANNSGYMKAGSNQLAAAFQLANGAGSFQAMTANFANFMTGTANEDRTDTANVKQAVGTGDQPGDYSITLTFTGAFV